ncbi:MAG: helix-turn-helix domain-containing protein [Rubrivivax sp.]|nr:helix-turn-helix domain-containing protein [Rubrivivax sp.]
MDYPLRLAGQLREHLRALRKRSSLTQAQLGQRLGLGQVRIAEIEADPGLVSVEQLIRILSALGATMVLRDEAAGAEEAAKPASKGPKKPSSKAPSKHGKGAW